MDEKKASRTGPGVLNGQETPGGRQPQPAPAAGREGVARNRITPLRLVLCVALLFAVFPFLPRVSSNPRLAWSFWGAEAVLLLFLFWLHRSVKRSGRVLCYEFLPRPVHYVQLAMHSCIYAYWGWYWPEVYHYALLIVAQLVFVYAFDMLVCWSRRDKWILGFGPFPIVLSTNLFLWFRDDWFFLQFLMVATGVLCKEFVTWTREGRRTHIFNPSAIALFLFSITLLVTNSTAITWGSEIATTLSRPPNMYLEIFAVGLVVQALFSVTLVTLSAAASLYVLNLIYTQTTGVYHFVDSNIPVSVFLGLHLLVTDPATSPRTTPGKIIFGSMYGAGVFALYGALAWLGVPRFYDKLLCVPPLNLTVRVLDRMGNFLSARFHAPRWAATWSPRQLNFAHMGVWIALFTLMMSTQFLGHDHPGRNPEFWRSACEESRWKACGTWVHTLKISCGENSARACFDLGQVANEGRVVPRDPAEAGISFGRACDLGLSSGCVSLAEFVRSDGHDALLKACDRGDGAACFILGSLYHQANGVRRDDVRALALFRQSCASGWWRGCGRLGESYLWGEGAAADPARAMESFEKACRGRYAPGCFNAGLMYRRGMAGPKDEAVAQQRFQRACELGLAAACPHGQAPVGASPVANSASDSEASGR